MKLTGIFCLWFITFMPSAWAQDDLYLRKDKDLVERYLKHKKYADSLNAAMDWKPVKDGLYISKNGDLGFKGVRLMIAPDGFIEIYQTHLHDSIKTPLKSIIDKATFRHLSGGGFGAYFKDKKYIYHTFGTSDGDNFYIVDEADYATFKIISDGCAAKDKNHVYDMRFGLRENIDVKTFKVFDADGACYAKDKNGYNRETDLLEGGQLKDPEFLKAKKHLDKM